MMAEESYSDFNLEGIFLMSGFLLASKLPNSYKRMMRYLTTVFAENSSGMGYIVGWRIGS